LTPGTAPGGGGAMIITIYRVIVDIPSKIADRHHGTPEYNNIINMATKDADHSGSNFYADCEEWAEFSELEKAQDCEEAFKTAVKELWKITYRGNPGTKPARI
jgi:hypothetical protein